MSGGTGDGCAMGKLPMARYGESSKLRFFKATTGLTNPSEGKKRDKQIYSGFHSLDIFRATSDHGLAYSLDSCVIDHTLMTLWSMSISEFSVVFGLVLPPDRMGLTFHRFRWPSWRHQRPVFAGSHSGQLAKTVVTGVTTHEGPTYYHHSDGMAGAT